MSSKWADRDQPGARPAAGRLVSRHVPGQHDGDRRADLRLARVAARDPRSRHHPINAARIRDALPGRRIAGARARDRDRAAIRIARAAVRAAGRALRRRAAVFAAGNVGRLRSLGTARRTRRDLVASAARAIATRYSRSPPSTWAASLLQVGKTSEARNQLLSNFRRVLMLGAGFALRHRRGRRSVPDPLDAEAAARSARCGPANPADRPDRRSRARLRHRGRGRRVERPLQRDARAHHDADPRHAQRARFSRARPAHADDALARHRRIGACHQRSRQASRSAVGLPRGIRARAVDADDVDGHLGSRDRHDEAERDRGRRSPRSRRKSSICTKTPPRMPGSRCMSDVPADLTVPADRDRLRQALANLVDNAIKYTPRGGRVELSAARSTAIRS